MNEHAAGGNKVLIIDDDQVFRGLMRRVLESAGFSDVVEASNGADGLTAIERERPDLVVLDIMMEQVNGLQFLKSLRAGLSNGDPAVPVIVVTGVPSASIISAASSLDCDAFIKKDGGLKVLADKAIRVVESPTEKAPPVHYLRVSLPEVDKPDSLTPTLRRYEGEAAEDEREVSVHDAIAGTCIAREIVSEDDVVLLAEGTPLTPANLARLRDVSELIDLKTVWIRDV